MSAVPVRRRKELGAVLCRLLRLEQLPLSIYPPAIAGEGAAGADHAMAGHHEGHSIGGAGPGHSPGRVGVAQFAGQLAVAAGFATWYLTQSLPDSQLKDRAAQVQCADAIAAVEVAAFAYAGKR